MFASSGAEEYLIEAIRKSNDKVAMYNLAHIYIYDEKTEEFIDKSIELLINSIINNFYPSEKLLCLLLIKKYGFDIEKIINCVSKFTKYVDKLPSIEEP